MLLDQLPDRGTPALTDETVTENGTSLFKTTWLKIRTLFEDRFVRKGRSDHDTYISSSRDSDQPITIWDSYDGQTYGLITSKRYIGLYDSTNSTWIWRTPIFPSEAAYTVWPIGMGGTGSTTKKEAASNLGVLPMGAVNNVIPNNSNINSYSTAGVYKVTDSSSAGTMTNLPTNIAGVLRVFDGTGADRPAGSTWLYPIQEYITYTALKYIRKGESGSGTTVTWSPWEIELSTRTCKKYVTSTGTSNGWSYDKWSDGTITARKNLSGSITEYSTANGFHCFYIADIATPFTMDNANYTVLCDWKIGTGFSMPAGTVTKSKSKFNAYVLGTANGTVNYQLCIYLVGACSAAT